MTRCDDTVVLAIMHMSSGVPQIKCVILRRIWSVSNPFRGKVKFALDFTALDHPTGYTTAWALPSTGLGVTSQALCKVLRILCFHFNRTFLLCFTYRAAELGFMNIRTEFAAVH